MAHPRCTTTAVCLLPWGCVPATSKESAVGRDAAAVQRLREKHDHAFERWPPHINFLFPFVQIDSAGTVVEAVKTAVTKAGVGPLELSFASFDAFVSGGKAKAFLTPTGATAELARLHAELVTAFPQCASERKDDAFHPHLSVGQFAAAEWPAVCKQWTVRWNCLRVRVAEIAVLVREADTPFRIHCTIALPAPVPPVPTAPVPTAPAPPKPAPPPPVPGTMTPAARWKPTKPLPPPVTDRTAIAVDVSGSTMRAPRYWKQVASILQQYLQAPGGTTFLGWDTKICEVSGPTMAHIIANQGSADLGGGTTPQVVASWCVTNNFRGTLLFITDGEVGAQDIQQTDAIMGFGEWSFVQVKAYILDHHSTALEQLNLSCACPFTRASPSMVYGALLQMNTNVLVPVQDLSAERQAILTTISTPEEFLANVATIEAIVGFASAGALRNVSMRTKLLQMQRRIVHTMSLRAEAETKSESSEASLYSALSAGDLPTAEAFVTAMVCTTSDMSWHAHFERILRMTEGELATSVTVNAIKANAVRHAAAVAAPDLDSVPADSAPAEAAGMYTCPISMEEDTTPVLLFRRPEETGFWAGLPVNLQNQLIASPMLLLAPFMKEHRHRFVQQLDHHMSLATYRQYCTTSNVSHISGRPVLGVVAAFGQTRDHVRATDAALYHAFTGGLKLGNATMWYIVLWQLMEDPEMHETEYLRAETGFLDAVRAQLMYRMQHCKTFASLSGLAGTVNAQIPWGAAAWFVYGGVLAHCRASPGNEAARMHLPYMHVLKKLVQMQRFPVPDGVDRLLSRLSALSAMFTALKFVYTDDGTRRQSTTEEQQDFMHRIAALYQHCVLVGDRCVLLDGPANPAVRPTLGLPAATACLSVAEIVGLAGFLHPNASLQHCAIPADWMPPAMPAPQVNFPVAPAVFAVPVSPQTARPYYIPDPTEPAKTWFVRAQEHFRVENPYTLLARHRHFMDCTADLGKYPTQEEYIVWTAARLQRKAVPVATLPASVMAEAAALFEDFAPIMAALAPAEAVKRYMASCSIRIRMQIEHVTAPAAGQ